MGQGNGEFLLMGTEFVREESFWKWTVVAGCNIVDAPNPADLYTFK
jgi:hypothetical protein